MADLELESRDNKAERSTWLIAAPADLGPQQLKDFDGDFILEVRPGTSLSNFEQRVFGGIFARGSRTGVGVLGQGTNSVGVHGRSTNGVGIWGHGDEAREGVLGDSSNSHGVVGLGVGGKAGMLGQNHSPEGAGVRGEAAPQGTGVLGTCSANQAARN